MERRTHTSPRRPHPETMSRLQRDLSTSSHQQNLSGVNGDTSAMIRRTISKGRIPHVCVIGAGVAGLRCADLLLQHGVKVTILEGRDRVGGRLCQTNQLGHLVDLGPNWIHGTDDNPILDLAKATDTITNNWDGRQSVFDKDGQKVSDKDSAKFTERVWEIIEEAMAYSNENSATIPANKSLMDYVEEKAHEMFPSSKKDQESQAEVDRERLLHMAEMWGAFVGSPIQRQSLKFFWLEECIDGENLFVAETYHKVLERIAEPALKKAEVKYGHKVSRIISKEEHDGKTVTIEIADGKTLTFDEVVTTTPLGWLKRNYDAFEPALPPRLIQAIESISYGHLDKVYITFPSAFWGQHDIAPSNSTNVPTPQHELQPNVTATTAPLHQSSSSAPQTYHYPGFTHWTSPHYATDTNPSHWNQECVNLAALPQETAHPTLLFYTFGPTSLHIASILRSHPSASSASAQTALLEFFKPYYSLLPNYSASSPACRPIQALATGWANDELAGYGSYCNFQIGLERGDDDIEVMRRGMPERGVWLAGEHTAPFVALGTVTGAYWAGEGVARRILGAYGLGGEGKKRAEAKDGH